MRFVSSLHFALTVDAGGPRIELPELTLLFWWLLLFVIAHPPGLGLLDALAQSPPLVFDYPHSTTLRELARKQLAASQKSHKKKPAHPANHHTTLARQASSSRNSRSITPAERDHHSQPGIRRPSLGPPGASNAANKSNPKRRSTLNSSSAAARGTDGLDGVDDEMKMALDISLKEAQSLGIVVPEAERAAKERDESPSADAGEEEDTTSGGGGGGRKKRKRVGDTDDNMSVLSSRRFVTFIWSSSGTSCKAFFACCMRYSYESRAYILSFT